MENKQLPKQLMRFYGIGNAGFAFMMMFEAYYFQAFLTDFVKLPYLVIGLILTITSTCDFVIGLLNGYIIYRSDFKWGKYRSWFLFAAIFVLFTYPFQFMSFQQTLITAIIICLGFIISHAFATIGQVSNLSMLVTLTTDMGIRSKLAARRSQFTAIASLVFSVIAFPIVTFFGKLTGNETLGFTVTAVMIALIFCVTFLVAYFTTSGINDKTTATTTPMKITVMLKTLTKNPPLIALFFTDLIRNTGNQMIMGFAYYYYTYSLQRPELMAIHMALSAIGSLLGAFLEPFFSRKIHDAKHRFIVYCAIQFVLLVASFFFALQHPLMLIVLFALFFIFQGASVATQAVVYANASVYSEWKTGDNLASVIMGMTELPIKTSIIFKGLLITGILSALGFVANQAVGIETGIWIARTFTLVPAAGMLVSGLIMFFFYKLDTKTINQMHHEIIDRKIANQK